MTIEWLTGWVTQIILFILLAMIIELLLPNSSMKKYINMVVGLLLILIFLQPLFQLFNVDIDDVMKEAMPILDTTSEEENMKNLIELKKSEIQASQAAYVVEEMAVQMEKQAEEGLREKYGVNIQDISLQFKEKDNIDLENLENIEIVLNQNQDQNQTESQGTVEEVVIDIGEEQLNDENQSTQLTKEVKNYLHDSWQLTNQQITILWEGGV
ncbi:stage III sporulation protein AF [Aquibacillus kalidii]|uniref:stage III sporulation protein AF n=1 Tax=Aquibacillus kalidii TaxID=2762597 RepID=UPI002E2D8356|nr:stage III sporulation protein AF [Aquibacillus kalidii]